MAWWSLPLRVLHERIGLWLAISSVLALAYYAALLGAMMLRFTVIPNYGHVYDAPGAYWTIWTSTPSTRDALRIMADQLRPLGDDRRLLDASRDAAALEKACERLTDRARPIFLAKAFALLHRAPGVS